MEKGTGVKITKDNIGKLVHNLDALERAAKISDTDAIEKCVEGALKTFGFVERDTVAASDSAVTLDAVRLYWKMNRRPYHLWLTYQDMSRDWFVNSEIKSFRGKIEKSRTQLIYLLLDLAQTLGKVFDK